MDDPAIQSAATFDEARRVMEVCNACRYCEGFCAVFPAMERLRTFADADLVHLANLCHNCKACYYACQYAPPHEFAINVPASFAGLRIESYAALTWPRALRALFHRNGKVVMAALLACVVLALSLLAGLEDASVWLAPSHGPGAFYRVIPWRIMAGVAAATLGFALLVMVVGAVRFWRLAGSTRIGLRALLQALHDIVTLRNLGGSGYGCNDRDEAFSQGRRRFHHALFYGFFLCAASTVAAAVQAYVFAIPAPYPVLSVPVMLGLAGGVAMVIGSSGLVAIKVLADPAPSLRVLAGGEYALLAQLMLVALTGLLLLAFRDTAAMGPLLAIHLGVVLSLFLTIPYSRFVHGLYRSLALVRAAADRRQN